MVTVTGRDDRGVGRIAQYVVTATSALVGASILMPWATLDTPGSAKITIRPGAPGLVLVALCVGLMGMAWSGRRESILRARFSAGLAVLTASVCIALALRAISRANGVIAVGPATTSFAFGAGIAVAASLAIVVVSAVESYDHP